MALQSRTIQKLFREDFPGTNPLFVSTTEQAKLAADLKASLERFHDVDLKDYDSVPQEEKTRHVFSFSIKDPDAYYCYGTSTTFRLVLDDQGRVTIKVAHSRESAPVSNVDELVRFVLHCKQRLERKKALKAKRDKVKDLLAQAILAQVRKLAKEEKFDFMSETDARKLNLFVKLSADHSVVLHIPFKEFKRFLPQLRSVIVTLRELHKNGIRFRIVGRSGLPWRKAWVSHENL